MLWNGIPSEREEHQQTKTSQYLKTPLNKLWLKERELFRAKRALWFLLMPVSHFSLFQSVGSFSSQIPLLGSFWFPSLLTPPGHWRLTGEVFSSWTLPVSLYTMSPSRIMFSFLLGPILEPAIGRFTRMINGAFSTSFPWTWSFLDPGCWVYWWFPLLGLGPNHELYPQLYLQHPTLSVRSKPRVPAQAPFHRTPFSQCRSNPSNWDPVLGHFP